MSFETANTSIKNTSSPAGIVQENATQTKMVQKEKDKPVQGSLWIQPKLTIGSPGDPYEREADAVADNVMRMPESGFIQRKCTHCEEEKGLQRKPLSQVAIPFLQAKSEATVNDDVANSIQSSKGGGSALDADINSFMSDRFGYDFGSVKIHTDRRSVQLNQNLNARAFTVGNDVYFNEGQYRPGSSEGKHLLAHELAHVVQQGENKVAPSIQRMIPCPSTLNEGDPVPAGFKPYYGNSSWFHCGYRGI